MQCQHYRQIISNHPRTECRSTHTTGKGLSWRKTGVGSPTKWARWRAERGVVVGEMGTIATAHNVQTGLGSRQGLFKVAKQLAWRGERVKLYTQKVCILLEAHKGCVPHRSLPHRTTSGWLSGARRCSAATKAPPHGAVVVMQRAPCACGPASGCHKTGQLLHPLLLIHVH